jgi:hypothetical protein
MHIIGKYVAIVVLGNISIFILYLFFPYLRPLLIGEDRVIENISAYIFLVSAILGGIALYQTPAWNTSAIRWLRTLTLLGLFFFGEEISWGARLFGFDTWTIRNVEIDAAHDLVLLGFSEYQNYFHSDPSLVIAATFVSVLVGASILFALRRYLTGLIGHLLANRSRHPLYLLIATMAFLLGLSSIVDLDIVRWGPLRAFEEMTELSAGLALFFAVRYVTDTLAQPKFSDGSGVTRAPSQRLRLGNN